MNIVLANITSFVVPIAFRFVRKVVMEQLIINMAVSIVLSTVKNAEKKESLKRAMLKIRNSINMAYIDDPDFQS